MSTEQSDITEQATTSTPTTTPKREKNPKRVAAGKLVAERTRLAREQQKKAAAEAAVIIANNKAKKATPAASNPVANTQEVWGTPSNTVADSNTEDETSKSGKVDNSSLSTTQWIGVAGIVVSLIGIYYKREELMAAFSKKKTPEPVRADRNCVAEIQPVRGVTQPRGVKHLD